MAVELATAYISLVPSLKGAQSAISKELGSVDTTPAGTAMGEKMSTGILGSVKRMVGAGIAIAAGGMFAGFISDAAKASDATDKFKATMSFAGMDTSAITNATKAAKDYADQTVYDLPTIQNMTAQLASNGVRDYTGLTQAAGNLNAVAGGNADTFKSVAMVMTQTAGAGKLTTENWNQMADAIPGAAGPLMKAMQDAGAYTGNFRDAMAAGQITSDEFNAALMKLGTDPVAVEAARSTKTFEGSIGNLTATINSGLMGALNAMKPAITGVINGLSTGIGAVTGGIGAIFSLLSTGNFTGGIGKALGVEEDSKVIDVILSIRDGVIGAFGAIGAAFSLLKTGDFNGGIGKALGVEEDSPVIGAILSIRDGVTTAFGAIKSALSGIDFGAVFGGLAAVLGPVIGQMVSLWSTVSPVQVVFAAIQPLLPQLVGMFGQLASTLGGTLSAVLTSILPMIMQLSALISESLGQVLATVLPTAVQLITMLGATFSALLPIIMPIIATVVQLAMTLISQLMPIITSLVASILPPVVTIFGDILTAIGPVIQMIAGLLIPIIQFLMPVVVTVFSVIANIITAAMQIVMGIIQVVTGIISGNWAQVWDGILNIFSGIWNTILALVSGVLAIVGSIIASSLNVWFGIIGSILGAIGGFFADTWNNIIGGVSGFIGNLLGFFSGLPGQIMGFLSGAGTWLVQAGRDIINGLISGVQSMMGAIGNAILSLVPGPIVGVFKAALGINSPSRVFRGFGQNIVEGLILGTGDKSSDLDGTMGKLVMVPSAPTFAAPSAAIGGGIAGVGGAPIYVQNPFTGEYLLAQVDGRVQSGISQVDRMAGGMRR